MTSRPEYFSDAQVPDIERRMSEMVSIGTVEEQNYSDPKAPRVRVKIGNKVTGWIPWSSGSAGGNTDWEPLDKGEQVIMAAPSGDLSQAVILGTIHQNSAEAPDKDPDVTARKWKDGSRQSYNRKSHAWNLTLNTAGTFVVNVGKSTLTIRNGSASLSTDSITLIATQSIACTTPKMTVSGDVIVGGDVVASGVSLVNHIHTGVKMGNQVSGPPLGGSAISFGDITSFQNASGGSGESGGGPGSGGGAGIIASSAGDETEGVVSNGVPANARGVYALAPYTRFQFQQPPNFDGLSRHGTHCFFGFPAAVDFPENIYYERARPASIGMFQEGFLGIVSEFDQETSKWTDDVIDLPANSDGAGAGRVGLYTGVIPAGVMDFDVPGPFALYQSWSGVYYARVGEWSFVSYFPIATAGQRPVFWKLTQAEVDEYGELEVSA